MKKTAQDFPHIKGWGVDIDPKNDPTYPIKKRTDEEQEGYSWERPPLQPVNMEVLHSNERPNITAVYGTAAPPRGLSGAIRRIAFKYGEGSFGHWLPLLLADRIDVVEGVLEDLAHGRVPNIFAEQGLKAEWKFNPQSVVKKFTVGAVLIAATALLIYGKKRR